MHEGTHSSWELWDFLLRVGLAERTNRAPVTQSSVITIAAIVRRLHTGVCVCVCLCACFFVRVHPTTARTAKRSATLARPWLGVSGGNPKTDLHDSFCLAVGVFGFGRV